MTNALALVIVILAVIVVWCTFALTILIFFKGARIGEADIAHGDDPERSTSG